MGNKHGLCLEPVHSASQRWPQGISAAPSRVRLDAQARRQATGSATSDLVARTAPLPDSRAALSTARKVRRRTRCAVRLPVISPIISLLRNLCIFAAAGPAMLLVCHRGALVGAGEAFITNRSFDFFRVSVEANINALARSLGITYERTKTFLNNLI